MCSWKRLEPRKIKQPKALFKVTSKNSHGLPFLRVKVPMHDLQGQSWPSPGHHHRGTLNGGNSTWCQVTLPESSPKKGNIHQMQSNSQCFQPSLEERLEDIFAPYPQESNTYPRCNTKPLLSLEGMEQATGWLPTSPAVASSAMQAKNGDEMNSKAIPGEHNGKWNYWWFVTRTHYKHKNMVPPPQKKKLYFLRIYWYLRVLLFFFDV